MELKPGYKQTEVGVIPEDWEALPLGELFSATQLGGNYQNSEQVTAWPLIKMGNLGRGSIKLDKREYVTAGTPPSARDRLHHGDVLFNTRNTIDLVGKVAIWRGELPEAYFNSNIMRLKFDAQKVSSNMFMNFILNTPRSLSALRGIAIGTTSVAAIYNRDLVSVQVPVPTLAEQEAIAEALSDADALIDSLEQLIAKKRLLKQGAMQDLLTGKKRLPGFEVKWVVKRLSELGRCYRGVSYNPAADLSPHETDSTVRLLRSNNVQESQLDFDDMQFVTEGRVSPDQYLRQNDILICMANGSRRLVGKAAQCPKLADKAYTFGAFMGCFRPDPAAADEQFVSGIFYTENYRRHIDLLLAGSSINNLSPGNVESLEIPVPAQKSEQTAIAAILSDMDAEIAALEAKLSKARQVKQGMMQELLTGKTRLV
ncbi:MAG: restriction endonuclease subunit S [Luteolibacter sp.]